MNRLIRMLEYAVIVGFLFHTRILFACDPPDCYIRELQPALNQDCTGCSDWDCTNDGGAFVVPSYYACKPAGTGEGGKTICSSQNQQIADFYPCENDWQQSTIFACVGTSAGCVAGAIICATTTFATAGLAAACWTGVAACVVAAGGTCSTGACGWLHCQKDTANVQHVWRQVFVSLSGDECAGN